MSNIRTRWLFGIIAIEIIAVIVIVVWAIMLDAGRSPAQPAASTDTNQTTAMAPKVTAELFAKSLRAPTAIAAAPGVSSSALFVAERGGTIRALDSKGVVAAQPLLDITTKVQNDDGEMGLLGLAFHPDFKTNGFFYVNYVDKQQNTIIARYHATNLVADPASEKVVLKVKQPYKNHNGGALVFGPDSYLYIALGDGGSAGDPENRAQDKNSVFGKLLRVDVNKGDPYSIPANNPFVGQAGTAPEIWAYGLRNPWRVSFDRTTKDLYIADVGQGKIEEVNVQQAGQAGGQNYGWRCYEGTQAYNATNCNNTYLKPTFQYSHDDKHCSITGGYVYRGNRYPNLAGKYFYGDFCGAMMYAQKVNGAWQQTLVEASPYSVSTYGEDNAGELYFADINTGNIYHITDTARQ